MASSEENTTIEESSADDSKDSTTDISSNDASASDNSEIYPEGSKSDAVSSIDNGPPDRKLLEETGTLAHAVPARAVEVNITAAEVMMESNFAPPAQSIADKVDASLARFESQREENPAPKTSRKDRQNWLKGCLLTFKYLSEISKDKKLAFRASDKTTTMLLLLALVGSIVFALGPHFGFAAFAMVCYVTADLMLMAGILIFVVTRFGIIRAMEPRFALICWHLMVGTGLLALVLGFNIVAGLVLFVMRDKVFTLTGGGM